jgi:hypothetical protein
MEENIEQKICINSKGNDADGSIITASLASIC